MYDRGVAFYVSYLGQNIKFFFSSETENFYSKSYYKTLIIVGTTYDLLQLIEDLFNQENLL